MTKWQKKLIQSLKNYWEDEIKKNTDFKTLKMIEDERLQNEKSQSPFDKDEEVVMDLLVQAHNKFLELKREHPMEVSQWNDSIHQLQFL